MKPSTQPIEPTFVCSNWSHQQHAKLYRGLLSCLFWIGLVFSLLIRLFERTNLSWRIPWPGIILGDFPAALAVAILYKRTQT